MSKEIKTIFIKKHITYVGTFILVWSFPITQSYFSIFYAAQDLDKISDIQVREDTRDLYYYIDDKLMRLTIYVSLATGLILSIIRALEPYFKYVVASTWKSWFGEALQLDGKKMKEKYVNDSLGSFLTSSLNVELVHVIL
jgi:hypothetical protein